jgi:hypothetical protein
MKIWIYWSKSNSWIYFYIILKKTEKFTKFYWSWAVIQLQNLCSCITKKQNIIFELCNSPVTYHFHSVVHNIQVYSNIHMIQVYWYKILHSDMALHSYTHYNLQIKCHKIKFKFCVIWLHTFLISFFFLVVLWIG